MMNALQTLREHLIAQAVPEEMVQTRIQEAETEISTMITEQTHLLTEQWENEHPGQSPTFVQLHELHNRARMMGEEMFLAQVIESIEPQDEDPEQTVVSGPTTRTAQWWTDETLEPSEETQELVEQVWPDRTVRFRVWAADLMQARTIDGLPVPTSPAHELAAEVAAEVDRVLMTISSPSST